MKKRPWDENKFTKILKEVGIGMFRILKPRDPLSNTIYSTPPDSFADYAKCAAITTSVTTVTANVDFKCEGIVIPRGSPIVAFRTFRYCSHNGSPHLNADDNIIFPDKTGNIWKVAKTDSPDHYIPLTMWSGTQVIDSAYHLPTIFSGEYSHYVNCGAYVPISVE